MYEELYRRIFQRIDSLMKKEKLFLDYEINLVKLARLVGTNRTYASRAICMKYKNLKEYLNKLRLDNLFYEFKSDNMGILCDDPDDFANKYGFRTRRSLDRVLNREKGCTYSRMMHEKKALGEDFTD